MPTNIKPIYQRILLKLSGEALQGVKGFGIDVHVIKRMAQEVKKIVALGVQVGVVVGGGNFCRGAELAQTGVYQVVGDHMGMLATIMNGLVLRDVLHQLNLDARLMSAIPLNGICDNYRWDKAISLLRKNRIVIFVAGTGNPFFTTDSAACLRGIEIKAEVILKATKVDGVFSVDPVKHPDAMLYDQLNYRDVLNKEFKVMDLPAFTLARDHNLPIHIFNMYKHDALQRVVMGDKEGTLITQ